MIFKDTREFISALEKEEEVQRIEQEVAWNLEAGAILRRTYERRLPAPFFQKIKGYDKQYRMFGGTLSSLKRIAIAMGVNPDTSYRELMEIYLRRTANPLKPVLVKDAPCKENIHIGKDVNLFEFPAPMLHDGDGGRYLCTWHANITKDPDTGWVNWSMCRAMIHTKNTMGGLIETRQHLGLHFDKYETRGKPMPFAISIGPDPISALLACSKIPYGVDEGDWAGGLRERPVEMVKCETVDLDVPATSEIVIEGEVPPHEREWEGPFGEYTGYRASPRDKRPVYHVKAITHRNNPILTMSCMGVPIDDSAATSTLTMGAYYLMELRRKGLPVVDLYMYPECVSFLIVVSVKVKYANEADRIAHTIWAGEAAFLPYVIVVEDDVDPSNWAQVFHALSTKCHPERGIRKVKYSVGHPLVPFATRHERLNKMGAMVYFDCTWPTDWDPSIAVPPRASFDKIYPKEVQKHVLDNWGKYGFKKMT